MLVGSFTWRVAAVVALWPVTVMAGAATAGAATTAGAAAEAFAVKFTSLPDRFPVGQAGVMSVSATRSIPGCVRIRALMLITLQGIDYGDLKVEVQTSRGWEENPISRADDNTLRAEDNWVDVNFLCEGQSRALQHRITFLPGAPSGSALIDFRVSSHGDSAQEGRAKATRPVAGAAAPSPSPTRGKASATPLPAPTAGLPEPSAAAGEALASGEASGEASAAVGRADRAAPTRPVSTVVLVMGSAGVVVGLAALLIVLLLMRRGRAGRPQRVDPAAG